MHHFLRFLRVLGCGSLLSVVALVELVGAPSRPPSLVLMLADDLGWGDPGCYQAASRIPTPNLDRLAAEGLRFTDAHTPSSVCTPTRYALLTGRYAWRTRLQSGVLWGYSPPLIEPGRLTLASLLQEHGYATACVGKWHLGLGYPTSAPAEFGDGSEPAADPSVIDYRQPFTAGPWDAGFDRCFVIPASLDMDPYYFLENDRPVLPPTLTVEASVARRQGGGGFWRAGPRAPGFTHEGCLPRLTEVAEAFLRRQSAERPFFLYFPLTAPHAPWVPAAGFQGRTAVGPYGDFVVQVDDVMGRLLRALDEGGLAENTLVLFTSDNGSHWVPGDIAKYGHRANGAWRGMKADLFEGGHRVPLIARWPARVRPGRVTSTLVGLQDVVATMADLVGAELGPEAAVDSLSFRGVLEGAARGKRESQVHHSINGSFALRDGGWKLLVAPDSGGWSEPRPGSAAARDLPAVQLYHLTEDPAETTNLAEREPKRVDRMTAQLEAVIRRGRSTPGPEATNAVPVVLGKAAGRAAR